MHLAVIFLVIAAVISGSESNHTRTKRMYGMCPPNFYRIGSACYFISSEKLNWLDAHFECRDKNSKLAEPVKVTDRQLRKYLMAGDKNRDDLWIGGTYEWNKHKWEWGYSGNEMIYQSFSQMDPGSSKDLQYHCAVLNPQQKYRWAARPCVDMHRFICQHKMPKVSEKNRVKVYTRWNETFPNQKANEVILNVIDGGQLPRIHRRKKTHVDKNRTMLSDSINITQAGKPLNDEHAPRVSANETTSPRQEMSRPAAKRSQMTPLVNFQNNETIEKPARHRTAFDKIAERKRHKEMKRRRKIQQKKKQKAIEAEKRRKAKEAAKLRPNDILNFPPPVTEILMFPEITPQVFATIVPEKADGQPEVTKPTETTTIPPPAQPQYEIKPIGEKRFSGNDKKSETTVKPRPEQNIPPQVTKKYDDYLKKLEERKKDEEARIEVEKRKRDELKKEREEEIARLANLAREQKEEEERLTEDIKRREEEERRIQQEEDRIKMEKAKKEAEEEQKALAKQAARLDALRRIQKKIQKDKEEKLRLALEGQSNENSASENETGTTTSAEPGSREAAEEERKLRLKKLRERVSKLTPEQRMRFHELKMQRKQQKLKRSHAISERSIIIP